MLKSTTAMGIVDTNPGSYKDKMAIKTYVEKNIPGIKNWSVREKVIHLRNFVYQKVKVGNNGNFHASYRELTDILEGKTPLLCGGISMTYLTLLEAFEIPARYIQTLSKDCYTSCDTHVLIEVFTDNHWVLEDATFNIEWDYDGRLLSTEELQFYFMLGYIPVDINNNFPMIKGRSIKEYYIAYDKLLTKIQIHNLQIWHDAPTLQDVNHGKRQKIK